MELIWLPIESCNHSVVVNKCLNIIHSSFGLSFKLWRWINISEQGRSRHVCHCHHDGVFIKYYIDNNQLFIIIIIDRMCVSLLSAFPALQHSLTSAPIFQCSFHWVEITLSFTRMFTILGLRLTSLSCYSDCDIRKSYHKPDTPDLLSSLSFY